MKECKDNSNEARDIQREVKNNTKRIAMEQVSYSQISFSTREPDFYKIFF